MFSKDINISYDVMIKNKIPVLINDESWKTLFDSINDKSIINLKNKLVELINEEIESAKMLRKLKIDKKKTMIKILNLSEEVNDNNNNNALELLDKCQEDIRRMNEDIDEITFRTEVLPKEIREANFNLLKETIRYAYKDLKDSEANLIVINDEIDSIRKRFRILLDEKHNNEEKINDTYSFLHGILGSDEMEKLDRDLLNKT